MEYNLGHITWQTSNKQNERGYEPLNRGNIKRKPMGSENMMRDALKSRTLQFHDKNKNNRKKGAHDAKEGEKKNKHKKDSQKKCKKKEHSFSAAS